MNEWIGKYCRIWIRNLAANPIIYTCKVMNVSSGFMTILDRNGDNISININDIIQIREEGE